MVDLKWKAKHHGNMKEEKSFCILHFWYLWLPLQEDTMCLPSVFALFAWNALFIEFLKRNNVVCVFWWMLHHAECRIEMSCCFALLAAVLVLWCWCFILAMVLWWQHSPLWWWLCLSCDFAVLAVEFLLWQQICSSGDNFAPLAVLLLWHCYSSGGGFAPLVEVCFSGGGIAPLVVALLL